MIVIFTYASTYHSIIFTPEQTTLNKCIEQVIVLIEQMVFNDLVLQIEIESIIRTHLHHHPHTGPQNTTISKTERSTSMQVYCAGGRGREGPSMLCDSAIILRLQVGYYRFMHITSTFYSRTKVIAKSARTSPLHNFNIVCAAPMAKYSKVYLRNKKESNISTPLRYSFLSSIFVDQMSVKNAALKWKIHYSSAKIIARMAKRSNLQSFFKNNQQPTLQCSWKELADDRKASAAVPCQKQMSGCDSTDSFMSQNLTLTSPPKIQIISTIGWDYLKGPSTTAQC